MRNCWGFWQPHFGPTVRIPQRSSKGLTAPTAPVKLLKVRELFNLGAEGLGLISAGPISELIQLRAATNLWEEVDRLIGALGLGTRSGSRLWLAL